MCTPVGVASSAIVTEGGSRTDVQLPVGRSRRVQSPEVGNRSWARPRIDAVERHVGAVVVSRGRGERFAGAATCLIRFGELPTLTEPTITVGGVPAPVKDGADVRHFSRHYMRGGSNGTGPSSTSATARYERRYSTSSRNGLA
jgi:hypothetical protein